MTKEQALVKEFMTTFGQEYPSKPTIPSLEVRKLRAKLILEEALETIAALGFDVNVGDKNVKIFNIKNREIELRENTNFTPDIEEIADGLADLHYVAYCGTALACGLDMEPIFAEVHRSNMSKLWTNNELQEFIQNNPSLASLYQWKCLDENAHINAKVFLVKDKDGKVIKSPSYSPANLKPLIEAQCK